MAVVMSAGPQIVTATFFATSQDAKRNSLAFLTGVAAATTIGVTVFFLLGSGIAGKEDGGKDWLDWLIIGLLVILMIWVFVRRNESEPPKWMGKLQTADPRFAFRLGLVLFIAMPTDIITMLTVGGYLVAHHESLLEAIPFILMTSLLVGSPLLVLEIGGERAQERLPVIRQWMQDNAWVVNEFVIGFFLVIELKAALSG
jgi:threonine/homoserine/homoserine lactone efflux protein